MKTFFNITLAQTYGYGMAVYIASEATALQRGIDATNRQRRAAGRRLLEDATVEEVLSAMRNRNILAAKPDAGRINLMDTDAAG
jgi:hypothetical protein